MSIMGRDCSLADWRAPDNLSSRIAASSSILVTALLKAVSELYPYDMVLTCSPSCCSWLGKKSRSQRLPDESDQVFLQWPPRPWTATMLKCHIC
jgi:hypothetical protein